MKRALTCVCLSLVAVSSCRVTAARAETGSVLARSSAHDERLANTAICSFDSVNHFVEAARLQTAGLPDETSGRRHFETHLPGPEGAGQTAPVSQSLTRRATAELDLSAMPPSGRRVVLSAYDPNWKLDFEREAALLAPLLGDNLVRIEHIGSTSIPNMTSKPIIDILIEVRSLQEVDRANPRWVSIGYEPRGEQGIPGRRYFRKGSPTHHTHHVHIHQSGDPNIGRHLAFRDYLTWNGKRAREYSDLKTRLARMHEEDPAAYQQGKDRLASEITAEACAWAASRNRQAPGSH